MNSALKTPCNDQLVSSLSSYQDSCMGDWMCIWNCMRGIAKSPKQLVIQHANTQSLILHVYRSRWLYLLPKHWDFPGCSSDSRTRSSTHMPSSSLMTGWPSLQQMIKNCGQGCASNCSIHEVRICHFYILCRTILQPGISFWWLHSIKSSEMLLWTPLIGVSIWIGDLKHL